MSIKLSSSLDWEQGIRKQLSDEITSVIHYDERYPNTVPISQWKTILDLETMLKSLDRLITEISRAEVQARQTKSSRNLDELLQKCNSRIESLRKYIILAKLSS